jgi:myo-inositol 2-dehydrogenase / D-chiro-inositol 1-dehydrogenase
VVLRVALIGCGRMAQRFHLKTLLESAEVVAICDIREDIARDVALRYGIKKVYPNYKELVADKDLDAVVITTSPASHFEIVEAAAKAGKHIFVEKPLADTVEQCKKTIEICTDHHVKLMVGFMRRFDEALAWSKERINAGELGRIFVINSNYNLVSTYGEYLKETDAEIKGEGTASSSYKENLHLFLINNLIHHTDLISWMAGPVDNLLASGLFADDHFTLNVIINFENKTTGHLQFNGFLRTDWHETLVLHGSKGSLFITMFFPYLTTPSNSVLLSLERHQRISPLIVVNSMYKNELKYFLNRIENNLQPEPDGHQALAAQKVVDAIERSLKQQTWVKIE